MWLEVLALSKLADSTVTPYRRSNYSSLWFLNMASQLSPEERLTLM
jgi:hypothetical protein